MWRFKWRSRRVMMLGRGWMTCLPHLHCYLLDFYKTSLIFWTCWSEWTASVARALLG